MKASAVSTITKSLPIALSVLVNYSLLATLGYINLFQKKYLKSIKQGQNFEIAEKPLFAFSDVKKNGAMGTKNSTMSIDAVKFDQSRAMGEARMVANDIITLRKTSWYYFRQNKEAFLLVSKRNLAKVYGKDQVQEYMKKNSIDFDKVEDIEKAIFHLSVK